MTDEQIAEIARIYVKSNSADVKFREIQGNFSQFLNLRQLNSYITLINYNKDYAKSIRELCINTASIFLKFDKILDAQSTLKKGKEIAEKFEDKYFKALVIMLEVSCAIKQRKNPKVILDMLKEPLATFESQKVQDGIADVYYVKGMQLMMHSLEEYKKDKKEEMKNHNHYHQHH